MYQALQDDDLEAFYTLLAERAGLIEQLAAAPRPVNPTRDRLAEAFKQQQRRLEAALAREENRLREALGEVTRSRQAHRQYRQQPVVRSLLNKNLQG